MKEIKILGSGCRNCETTYNIIQAAAQQAGVEVKLEKITDMAEIMSYGVMSTPGVVVDGKLVHAGGLEISRALSKKEPSEFDLVFDVKADGMFNILAAARGMPIGATVSFSSVAGRFGNNGQTDYSAANDLLCKVTSSLRRTRPDTRGVAIDWTAWAGIGMATRGSIPAIMQAAGIDMLPPESGVPTVRRELMHGPAGELVVGGELGILVAELDPDGGIDVEAARSLVVERGLNMIGSLEATPLHEGLHVETTLDPTQEPFLFDHQVEKDTPYLPGVMGIETFAQLAKLLLPDHHVVAVRDVRFSSPFKFYRNEPRRLVLRGLPVWQGGGRVIVRTELMSLTQLRPEAPARVNEHFSAEVEVSPEPAATESVEVSQLGGDAPVVEREDVYRTYFHGPAYQVLDRVVVEGDRARGEVTRELPANAAAEDATELTVPRLVESCFQTAGIWEISERKTMALPAAVGRVRLVRQPDPGELLVALVETLGDGNAFNARIVDESGRVVVALEGYRTISLTSDGALWAEAKEDPRPGPEALVRG
jgi:small redox-active disulfide protein 2